MCSSGSSVTRPYASPKIVTFDEIALTEYLNKENINLKECNTTFGFILNEYTFKGISTCEEYVEFVKNTFPKNLSLKGLKIALDCANGAAYKLAPEIFWELGADVYTYNNNPNGLLLKLYHCTLS